MTGILNILAGSIAAAIKDGYFNLVTLLLPGNGTNGAQNNTFVDSSSNNFTITRNGNTTQGTFSPFSQTGWSNYFDGVDDELTWSGVTAGSGAFSYEFWIYSLSDFSSSRCPLGVKQVSGYTNALEIRMSGTTINASQYLVANNNFTVPSLQANTWYHVVVCRNSSNQMTVFLNGTRSSTGAVTVSTNFSAATSAIGRLDPSNGQWVNGYISNVRLITGSTPYDPTQSTITVPTAPPTAITNTQFLSCQSNRFFDASTNASAITVGGSPSVQAFSPFAPTAAYSAATNGGSGYFDGNGDYVSIANQTALQMGTGDFQVEAWAYVTNSSAFQSIICIGVSTGGSTAGTFTFRVQSDLKVRWCINDNSTGLTSTNAITANAWVHLCASRVSGTLRIFINGVENGSLSDSTNYNNTSGTMIGAENQGGATNYFYGYISGLRVIKGSGVTSITVPTAPPTAITNTSALLNYTNGGIIDATGKNVLETVGNAQISTTQSKFGGSSMSFDGTGDYLKLPDNAMFSLSGGNYTIEFWLYLNSVSGVQVIAERFAATSGPGWTLYMNGAAVEMYGSSVVFSSGTLSTGQWYHIAVSRSGSTTYLFINGTQSTSTSNNITDSAQPLFIGARTGTGSYLNGYIDDLRITKGYARYTANFSVPTTAFALQ